MNIAEVSQNLTSKLTCWHRRWKHSEIEKLNAERKKIAFKALRQFTQWQMLLNDVKRIDDKIATLKKERGKTE